MESNFKSLLPISMRVFARTVSADLVDHVTITLKIIESLQWKKDSVLKELIKKIWIKNL
jgi:hypothetical protein